MELDELLFGFFILLCMLGVVGAACGMFLGPVLLACDAMTMDQLWVVLGTSLACMCVGFIGQHHFK